jgi:hypothetical protein
VDAPFWNNRDMFYTQIGNPTEEILRKIHLELALKIKKILASSWIQQKVMDEVQAAILAYLETCGPSAAVNNIAAGDLFDFTTWPKTSQPEEVLSDWMNDPKNYPLMKSERSDIQPGDMPCNRVPQYYPVAVKNVFNVRCSFEWITGLKIVEELKLGRTLQACFKNPGHYIAAVHYDEDRDEIVYNDSLNGFGKRMRSGSFLSLIEPYAIIYYRKDEQT